MNPHQRLIESGFLPYERAILIGAPLLSGSFPIVYTLVTQVHKDQPYDSLAAVGLSLLGGAVSGFIGFGVAITACALYTAARGPSSLEDKISSSKR